MSLPSDPPRRLDRWHDVVFAGRVDVGVLSVLGDVRQVDPRLLCLSRTAMFCVHAPHRAGHSRGIAAIVGRIVDDHGGTAEFAAISAVAVRHNDISNILSTAPDRFEPIYRIKPNREVDARPWCEGFHAAMRLRMGAWSPLLNTDDIDLGLLLPIFVHCVDDQGHPLLGPTRRPESKAFLRKAYKDIPAVVVAMRQYWMPIRYRRDAWLSPTWNPHAAYERPLRLLLRNSNRRLPVLLRHGTPRWPGMLRHANGRFTKAVQH
jgi:hypothetical protein